MLIIRGEAADSSQYVFVNIYIFDLARLLCQHQTSLLVVKLLLVRLVAFRFRFGLLTKYIEIDQIMYTKFSLLSYQ